MSTVTTSNGLTVEISDSANANQSARVERLVKAIGDINPQIAKLLKKVGYDKIKINWNDDLENGRTNICPQPDEEDFKFNVKFNDDVERTLNHEIGHALNDILGEQNNGSQNYSDTLAFKSARAADALIQATQPNSNPTVDNSDNPNLPQDFDSINDFYNSNPDEFLADINMARSESAAGRNNSKSVYSGLTAQQLLTAYPASANSLKNQTDFALNNMNNGGGPNGGYKQCPDAEWGGNYNSSKAKQARVNNAKEVFGLDPLILDLDGNGIQTTTLDDAGYFDVAQTGFGSRLAWVAGNDGILGIDLNANGFIDDGGELIGAQLSSSSSLDSFDVLADYDTNNDLRIDSADSVFSQLIVQGNNGISHTLSDLGIISINLTKSSTGVVDESGNLQTSIGSFTFADSSTGDIGSYILQHSAVDTTQFNQLEISPEIQALPNATGSGLVSSLWQALQADTSGDLADILDSFLSETNLEVQDHLLDQLLIKWTGSENPSAALHMDPYVFAVLEKFAGEDLVFPGTGSQPGFEHQLILQPAYTEIKNGVFAQLMLNRGPLDDIRNILRSNYQFDAAINNRIYDLTDVADYLLDLATTNQSLASLKTAQFLRTLQGLDLLDRTNFADFYEDISSGNLTLKAVIDNFGVNPSYTLDDTTVDRSNVTIDETVTTSGNDNWVVLGSGNVTFNASGDNTWLTTQTGSYDITLGGGTNKVYLGSGAASISAIGADITYIRGNIGDNELNFGVGTGVMDFRAGNVNLIPHTDSVNFGTGLLFGSVSLSAEGSDLIVQFGASSTDQLILRGELAMSSAKQISSFSFAGGATLTAEQFGTAGMTFAASGSSVTYDHSGSYIQETINLSGSGSTLIIGSVENTINVSGDGDIVYGGDADNTYNVTGSGNTILTGAGDNTVNSGGYYNQFYLGSAVAGVSGIGDNTILDSGLGNQFWLNPGSTQTGSADITVGTNAQIHLGTGHVDVNVGLGTGTTVIYRTGPAYTTGDSDTVNFGTGITQSDLYFWAPPVASGGVTQYDLNIDLASGEKIILNAGLAGGAERVEKFTFADSSELTLDQVLAQGVHVLAFMDPFFGGPYINRNFATWKEITTIVGDNGELYEGSGDDVITDTGNNNYINAGSGDNTIVVGANSTIVSNSGTNAITIGVGSGTTLIQMGGALGGTLNNGNDTLIFGAGISEESILASFTDSTTLQIDLGNGDVITIEGEDLISGGRIVETFTFADSLSFTAQQLVDMSVVVVDNSLDNETIDRTASTINERINNSGNFDTILLGAGKTTVNDTGSDNTVYGGTGTAIINASMNTVFYGGAGDATINVANGVSGVQVFEQTVGTGSNGFDSLVLAGAATIDDYTLSSVGKDLTFKDSLGADVLTIKDGLDATAVSKIVDDISFADDSHINFSDLIQRGVNVSDTSSNETVDRSFSAAKEFITHTGDASTFLLGSGDVVMSVGTNDTVYSGQGNNVFNIGTESGLTTIIEDSMAVSSGIDFVQLMDQVDESQVVVRAFDSNFMLGFPGNEVTVLNQLDGAAQKNISSFLNANGSILVDSLEIQDIADAIRSTSGDDVITGSRFGDIVNGGDGNDTISGGLGRDDLSGGLGDDTLNGQDSNDYLWGDDGDDTLNGGDGDDILNGYADSDTLNGGDGNDVVVGGTSNDTLSGGNGNDTYFFNLGDGVDTVYDQGSILDDMDVIRFGSGVTTADVAFYMDGNDLYLSQGSGDSIKVTDQTSTTSQIEKFELEDGHYVSSADVNLLIQQIAAYQDLHTEVNIASVNDVRNNQDLMTIVANTWHAA